MARQRDEMKREALLEAALGEIAQGGLAGLSVDAVARRSGFSTGTVYVYFKGKEALIEALYSQVKLGFAGLVFQKDGLPVRLAIETACRNYLHYCRSHPQELVFLDQIEAAPGWKDRVSSTTATAMRPLVKLLEQGKAERIVKDAPTEMLIAFLAGGLQASARCSMGDSAAHLQERTSEIITLCWSTIAA